MDNLDQLSLTFLPTHTHAHTLSGSGITINILSGLCVTTYRKIITDTRKHFQTVRARYYTHTLTHKHVYKHINVHVQTLLFSKTRHTD